MAVIDELHALGSGHQDHELDVPAAQLLHLGDGHVGAAAGSQHGVNDQHIAVGDVLGVLQEVEVRLQRLLIAVHTDMRHTGGGNQRQNTVLKAQTCAEDGNNGQLLAGQHGRFAGAQGRFDGLCGHRQIAGGLIGQQHGDLANQRTEILHAGVLVAHDRQLVLHQRVIHNVQGGEFFAHNNILRNIKNLKTQSKVMGSPLASRSRSAWERRR